MSVGLAWERDERAIAEALLAVPPFAGVVRPLVALTFEMTDVYPADHWAVRGEAPGYDTPDEDVYLDGRNIVLLAKASVFMSRHGLERVMLGPLAGNPFPDATPEFLDAMALALSLGLAHEITIATPLRGLHKEDVIRRGLALGVPLELTLSCMNPVGDAHCGACSKCRERREAFRSAGVKDETRYADGRRQRD